MPRNVRNFWIEAQVDGKKHSVATGPRRADGGFGLQVYIRDKGDIRTAVRLSGRVDDDGELVLYVNPGRPDREDNDCTLKVKREKSGGFTITTDR